ncbi:DUF3006 domain-containing protein [Deinococcus arenicola]|uniref:DUF3006 domain-containing protein n=1 Tax=Deinococcus arenicola TaxID=2994950 RepID=A0ABU4DVC0_9DEIO|nr:DUF3006 domain-containing protein [Deinococcus sp. ZS9-10]MDV6376390.1 DUF3006 domain-containing protein [Deinococcus sp. ZS9-10]
MYPGLDEARLMATEDRREYETYFVLERLRQHDPLSTIIRENVTPQLAAQQEQRVLKGLSLEAFSQIAAQRLTASVQTGDLSPAQVREAAQQLAQEAERWVNLKVITEERLTRDSEAAQQGQTQGVERMFQEAGNPATAQLLGQAMHSLELRGHDHWGDAGHQRRVLRALAYVMTEPQPPEELGVSRIIVDGIEGKYARVELPDGTTEDWSLANLPRGVKEGDVIHIDVQGGDVEMEVDHAETDRRRTGAQEQLTALNAQAPTGDLDL